jgi:SAM-dependent methyltransferase
MQEEPILRAIATMVEKYAPRNARIVDLSCGDGDILVHLAAQGHTVEGTHHREDDYILRSIASGLDSIPIHKGVNLSGRIPLDDSSFNVVVSTEVFEHLPSHVPVVTEVARILKRNGLFILTTPNIHRLASRCQFLLTGTHNLCGARLCWHIAADQLYTTHYNPPYFPVLHSLLHQNGLQVIRLGFTSCKWQSLLLLPLLYPLIVLSTLIEMRHFWKRSRTGSRDLLRWLLDPRLLLSDQMVVLARKAADSNSEPSPAGDVLKAAPEERRPSPEKQPPLDVVAL